MEIEVDRLSQTNEEFELEVSELKRLNKLIQDRLDQLYEYKDRS